MLLAGCLTPLRYVVNMVYLLSCKRYTFTVFRSCPRMYRSTASAYYHPTANHQYQPTAYMYHPTAYHPTAYHPTASVYYCPTACVYPTGNVMTNSYNHCIHPYMQVISSPICGGDDIYTHLPNEDISGGSCLHDTDGSEKLDESG